MADKKEPGYAFNYIADVGCGQQFQITGSLPVDADKKFIAAEFSKFRDVIEQHRTRSVIPNLEKGIEELELKLDNLEDTLKTIDERHANLKNLPTNEKAARDNVVTNIKHDRAELAHRKKVLAQAKKELSEV